MSRSSSAAWGVLTAASLAVACLASSAASRLPPDGSAVPIPGPVNDVRLEKSVFIPMRDGVRLSADLNFPVGVAGKLPVILVRTPYGKKGWRKDGRIGVLTSMFAGHGYVVVIQDKRGRYESEGQYTPAVREDTDGYDTVDWLVKQPWSNGKVGTYGCSDPGDAQVWLAPTRHPALAAMIPQASGSSVGPAGGRYRYFGAYNGGAFQLGPGASWMVKHGTKVFWRAPSWLPEEKVQQLADSFEPSAVNAPKGADLNALLWTLPTVDIMKRAGRPFTDWEDMLSHDLGDKYWRQFPYLAGDEVIDVPALFVNSWQDFGVNESLFQFDFFRKRGATERARNNQFIIISPTTHCDSELMTAPTVVGERDLGDARKDFWSIYLAWYAHWLKGEDNGVTSMPRVQYYVMGRNEWRSAEEWPPKGTQFTKFYLHSEGGANSRFGNGTLSRSSPGRQPADHYEYDPAIPVPSGSGPYDLGEGFFDQRNVEQRQDVLVYTTEALKEDLEIAGPVSVKLSVSSSAKDTDFTAKLVDVYPDGRAFFLQEGILRARYRKGFDRKVWMEPDGVYEIDISLDATSNRFLAGHRIRLEVSSSNFPRFDRNLNTGGRNYDETVGVTARNTVHHSSDRASYVLLPVTRD